MILSILPILNQLNAARQLRCQHTAHNSPEFIFDKIFPLKRWDFSGSSTHTLMAAGLCTLELGNMSKVLLEKTALLGYLIERCQSQIPLHLILKLPVRMCKVSFKVNSAFQFLNTKSQPRGHLGKPQAGLTLISSVTRSLGLGNPEQAWGGTLVFSLCQSWELRVWKGQC